jgi:hypothetical protein
MKKLATAFCMAALGIFALSTAASAQFLFVGGGASFPMSDYGDYADTGFLLVGGGGIPLGEGGLNALVEGFYGQNSHTGVDGDKTNPYGFMGGLEFDFNPGGEGVNPYVFGQAGILWHKYSSDTFGDASDSGFAYGAGAGLGFPLGGVNGWAEGRLMNASIEDSNTMFSAINVGISIDLGD